MSFELAVQSAIYTALINHSPLMSLATGGVLDDVEQDKADFPYVTIGEAQHNDWSTNTESGHAVTCVIHTWSRQPGRREIKLIQGAIYDALHRATLTDSGAEFIDCLFVMSESFLDPDGITRHGVQQFKLLIA